MRFLLLLTLAVAAAHALPQTDTHPEASEPTKLEVLSFVTTTQIALRAELSSLCPDNSTAAASAAKKPELPLSCDCTGPASGMHPIDPQTLNLYNLTAQNALVFWDCEPHTCLCPGGRIETVPPPATGATAELKLLARQLLMKLVVDEASKMHPE